MSASIEQRERAICMLAAGSTQKEVAEECGVDTRTIRRWVADPEFSARVEQVSTDLSRSVQARLKTLATAAVEALGDIVEHSSDGQNRIAAARTILDRVAPATTKQDVHVTSKMSEEEIRAKLEAMGWRKT